MDRGKEIAGIDCSGRAVSRRCFLRSLSRSAVAAGGAGLLLSSPTWLKELAAAADPPGKAATLTRRAHPARYWISSNADGVSCLSCHTLEDDVTGTVFDHAEGIVKCMLCAQECVIREGERGACRARENVDGELRSLVYGYPVAIHIDPIEKKPLYHFRPGSVAYSLATTGCPLHCQFCQNWEISQARPEDYDVPYTPPEAVVSDAARRHAPVIAFTYNEPTVFSEYMLDIATAAKKQGIACVLISCGFMNERPLAAMCDVLDAIKIDLKGFSPEFYRHICSAELQPVLRSIKQVANSGVHLEIVNLVVPTLNDSDKMLTELAKWVFGELGPDVPVHFTRFHPDYRMLNLPPTPVATLENAYQIARAQGIRYPFVGNVPGHPGNNTYCPKCGKLVIERDGLFVTGMNMQNGTCGFCAEPIAGVWNGGQ
ncbi:MAG TPA: AmmeMemoRadiSam system radical SAM enzyme [Acidobacteriota bacterium]|nr:AmmeMemoRadiSam system radical SAM enzyme [Acidobacteriota bacterium]